MSKNTIIRFPEQMTIERALNHNMDWTIRQLQTLTRMCNSLNNGLLCAGIGLACMTILWGLTEKEINEVQKQNRALAQELRETKEEVDILKDKEGRKQM